MATLQAIFHHFYDAYKNSHSLENSECAVFAFPQTGIKPLHNFSSCSFVSYSFDMDLRYVHMHCMHCI